MDAQRSQGMTKNEASRLASDIADNLRANPLNVSKGFGIRILECYSGEYGVMVSVGHNNYPITSREEWMENYEGMPL